MKLTRPLWIALGSLSFAIGLIGIVLPLLPTFPFFCLTLFCFGRSSEKLHAWFKASKWNKTYVEPFLKKKEMTIALKARILTFFTLFMGFGFIMMKNVPIGRIILAIVWIGHVLYFLFGIPTKRNKKQSILPSRLEAE